MFNASGDSFSYYMITFSLPVVQLSLAQNIYVQVGKGDNELPHITGS